MRARPAVVLVAHGTRASAGRAVVDELTARVAALVPQAQVSRAYVQPYTPLVADVVAAQPAGRPVVVVPLLLSRGYHVQQDVGRAVTARPGALATPPLGPDPALVPVLLERLRTAGTTPHEACVLVGAGSRFPEAGRDVRAMADLLGGARPGPVLVGYCTTSTPPVAEAVAAAGRPVTALPYLLAPGHFQRIIDSAGADRVAGVLGADPRVAALAARRAVEGLGQLG